MKQEKNTFNFGSEDFQNLFALLRLLIFVGTLWAFGAICSTSFHGIDPREVAQAWRDRVPLVFGWAPDGILVIFTAALNPFGLRYMIAPLAAMVLVIIAGANYVQDVYALKNFRDALHYVLASMFAIRYPKLVIDKGKVDDGKKTVNLINVIGGPGYVLVEPGNAAIFRHLREPGQSIVAATHFVAPFETIAQVIDLDEQQGDKDEITALTRDGIKVVLRDIHIRYRIKQEVRDGKVAMKTLSDPYPLEPNALQNMLYNMTVNVDGLDKWNVAVERAIVGGITDFIAAHSIDYLTAPRDGTPNPRIELNNDLFYNATQKALNNYGAELLWIDVGHMDISVDEIDDQRTNLWASEWIGDVKVSRAYSQAIHQAYQELGRAQAHAEMILSIADALRTASIDNNSREHVRKLLLARTAQVLDSINIKNNNSSVEEQRKSD
ncbi:MAG: hypothetical protein IH586_16305 [Anaerolineaceae bacterium]|nr:hypothetical protein [Anaerolineaceae bacterium]